MIEQRVFIRFAALFEAALAIVAVLLGWMSGVRPVGLIPNAWAAMVGVAATLPMIAFYVLATLVPLRPLKRVHDLLLSTLGAPLSRCRWHELALLAALAGICEELLFRGVLQPWIGQLGTPAAWIGTNVLFGLAHAVTPTYFVLATGIGLYLSAVYEVGGGVAAPMIAHTLYDFFAFVQVARAYRDRQVDSSEEGDAA